MKDKDIYKALKLIQKGGFGKRKLNLVCLKLSELGLIKSRHENERDDYELSIKGKIFIWDWENWKLSS